MTTAYNYYLISELEDVMTKDFYGVNSEYKDADGVNLYTEANVSAWISSMERLIVGYMGKKYVTTGLTTTLELDAAVPAGIRSMVEQLSQIVATNNLISKKQLSGQEIRAILDPDMKQTLDDILKTEKLKTARSEVVSGEAPTTLGSY